MKVAVVGSGISGLGCALMLEQKYEVHLFEADNRLGGHAHTSSIQNQGESFNVDTGFLVYNDLTYPHLKSLFKYLDVETIPSDMSLSIQEPNVGLEWAGDNLNTVFAQRKNIFNPRFYRLVYDILRFHRQAEPNRDLARRHRWTVQELFRQQRYSPELQEWYILPMLAAIWSTPEKAMLDFPAETFLTFFINHKLLQVNDRPVWRTVKNGSVNYVQKIAQKIRNIHLSEPVVSVKRRAGQLELISNRNTYTFDKVIFATQPQMTQKMYQSESSATEKILSAFKSEKNRAVLHKDQQFMPSSKKCWSSWNVQANLKSAPHAKVALTYFLNRLQELKTKDNILLTLNPMRNPDANLLEATYHHPIFDQAAIDAQANIGDIQGLHDVYFAGAWTRYGFHEDGLLSAVKVAERLEVNPPWMVS
ncbi:NAD(P)/FAD-dependent oxidoreductase [Pseudobdellovibrio exovorus]|uniref:Amine oxidase domain-containing protein n=1 Tax=Pseudobdellovibrio exovorus JSS TaxID=1184267 RepID=M4VB08_9BACT|nr:FAD-dependent oxidoreductase [Pseudobdellovibrio exovorus]AGH96403.1 hypothetical protein A11Q_2187 [Pseudobdellovibrio exovorus JSS]